MAHYCDLLVLLLVSCQQVLDLPGPHPQFLRGFVDHFGLHQLQQFLLFLSEGELPAGLDVRVAGVLEVLAEVIHEPQLGMILHEAEIIIRKLLYLLVDVVADVAGVPEHLS